MDQKQLSQLDPKLKAVYDRVMGVANAAPPPPADMRTAPIQPLQTQPTAPSVSVQPHFVTETVAKPQPVIQTTIPAPLPSLSTPQPNIATFIQPQAPAAPIPTLRQDTVSYMQPPIQSVHATIPVTSMSQSQIHTPHAEGSGKMFMVLFVILGIIFFVLYGVFWVQLFKIGFPPSV